MSEGSEVELISDGDGLAILGEQADVEQFCEQLGLSRAHGVKDFTSALRTGASLAGAGSEITATSGRWVQLTEESAKAINQIGLIETKTPGVKYAVAGRPGEVRQWLQIVDKPRTMLTNPAVLAGAAGVMAQMAMQQQMDAITDYLAVIDKKIDGLRKLQENKELARLEAVAQNLSEAMAIRDKVGRVSEVNWSKIQNSPDTIAQAQNLALRQLGDLVSELEGDQKLGDLKDATAAAAGEVGKWLWVLGRCFELQDALGILELDRVMATAPEELDAHRLGLQVARRQQLDRICQTTDLLLTRMETAVGKANSKVLFHPVASPDVVESRDSVVREVDVFHDLVGIDKAGESVTARRWRQAAGEQVVVVREAGVDGFDAAKRFGVRAARIAKSTGAQAKSKATDVSAGLGARVRRRKEHGSGHGRD